MKKALQQLPNCKVFRIEHPVIVGTPDRLICINGVFVAIETKKSKHDAPSPKQVYELDGVVNAGGIAIVAYPENWDEVYEFLHNLATGAADQAPDGTLLS
jgi:hypothetical protein